jgi:hypothetical protein
MTARHNFVARNLVLIITLLLPAVISAHPSAIEIETMGSDAISFVYFKLGFIHIIPLGFDHILFILCLFLLQPSLKNIVKQATVFTVAHSITLGLAMAGKIETPSHIIEPIIALSIVFVAVENMITNQLKVSRMVMVFAFGLMHGLGFAGVLADLGLPQSQFTNALICFNLGVEAGQLSVIVIAWFLIGKWFHQKTWYQSRIVNPISCLIAGIALYWTIERAFLG